MKTTGKVFIALFLLIIGAPVLGAELVNINTASVAELDTLPEIGPTLAQRIVEYRTGPNGPFETKEEIMEVSGIGPATYEKFKDLITVGSGSAAPADTEEEDEETDEESAPSTSETTSKSSSSPKGVPLDRVHIMLDGAVIAKAVTTFKAVVTDEKDGLLSYGVRYKWNFGDGTTSSDAMPVHTYAHPGTYVVTVSVTHRDEEASTRLTLAVLGEGIVLRTPDDGSVAVINNTGEELDIGGWMLTDLQTVFTIPSGTRLSKGGEVRFATAVTNVVGSTQTRLLFANGETAARVDEPKEVSVQSAAPAVTGGYPVSVAMTENIPSTSSAQLAAAAATSGTALPKTMLPWAGLGVVLVGGMAGAYYAGRRGETKLGPEEFEIE